MPCWSIGLSETARLARKASARHRLNGSCTSHVLRLSRLIFAQRKMLGKASCSATNARACAEFEISCIIGGVMIDPNSDGPAYCMSCGKESECCTCDLSPESLETIVIELRPRPVLPVGSIQYDHLPIATDLCAASLAWAVEQLNPQGVSCDLWV